MAEKGTVETKIVGDASKLEKSFNAATQKITAMKKSVALMINNLKNMSKIIMKMTDYTDDYVSSMRLLNTVFRDGAKEASKYWTIHYEIPDQKEQRAVQRAESIGTYWERAS